MSENGTIEWEISVPIFRNSVIMRQLALCLGLPFGFVIAVLLADACKSGSGSGSLYGLVLIAALFLLTAAFVAIVYGGKYEAGFVLDGNGIYCYTQKRQARKNRVINVLTVLLGLFSRNPTIAGAGLLAQSRQSVRLKWSGVKKVIYRPKQHTVMVRGGLTEAIAVFCTPGNYDEVAALIRSKTIKSAGNGPASRTE